MPLNELLEAVLPFFNSTEGGGGGTTQEAPPLVPNSPPLEAAIDRGGWTIEQKTFFQQELIKVQEQKDQLAGLIRPLILEEARRQNYSGEIPSAPAIAQQLIKKLAGKCNQPANGPDEAFKNIIGLKRFLTRACKNAEDPLKGRMALRVEIGIFINNLKKEL